METTALTSTPGVHQSLGAGPIVWPGLDDRSSEELLGNGVFAGAGKRQVLKQVCPPISRRPSCTVVMARGGFGNAATAAATVGKVAVVGGCLVR